MMMLSDIKGLKATEKDTLNIIYNANCFLLNETRSKLNVLVTGDILKIENVVSGNKRDICIKLLGTYNLSNCMVSMYNRVEWFIDIDGGFFAANYMVIKKRKNTQNIFCNVSKFKKVFVSL